MLINLIKKSKFPFVLATAVLVISLLVNFLISKTNIINLQNENLAQQMDFYAAEIDNFLQTGQIYLEGFSKNLVLLSDSEAQFLQLKGFLSPFPFFSQLNIVDSAGKIVSGFPQNKIGQLTIISEKNSKNQLASNTQLTIIANAYQKNPSLFVFIIKASPGNSEDPMFLLGESDLRANPLNTGLMTITNKLNSRNVSIEILDNQLGEIISFKNEFALREKNKSDLIITRNVALTNWQIKFIYPEHYLTLDAIYGSAPLAILILALFVLLIFTLVKNKGKLSIIKSETKGLSPEKNDWEKRIQDYKESLIKTANLNEIANLLLNYSELDQVSSVRIIFTENQFSEKSKQYYIFGLGKKSDNFAYLDNQIIEQVKMNQNLNIPDLHRNHQVHLNQGKDYPLAIFALPIKQGKNNYGIIWFGYDTPHRISEQEFEYIQELISVSKNQIALLVNNHIYKCISKNQHAALENIQSPVILLDKNDQILYSNISAEIIIRNIKDSTGDKIQDLIIDSSLLDIFRKNSYPAEYEFTSIDGKSYLIHSSKLQTNGDDLVKIYIFVETTREKNITSELSEYSALLSHDLRSPMTIIKGYTTMLPIMGQLNDQQREYVEKILFSVDEMTNLIKNLLNTERIKMGVNLFKQETDLINLINREIDALHPLAVQKRIDVIHDFKDISKEIVEVDPILFEQAIYNLIDNAIRFTPIQGKVTIGLGYVDNMVEINVEDTGCGIASVDIPHIFDKFYRVKISPIYNQAGSGIGLALVKSIVEKHNGEVGAISNLGKGSTFFIRIPKK